MISLTEAIKIIQASEEITYLGETDDTYLIVLNNDDEGCETVNKTTGERGFMWTWDFIDLKKANLIRDISLE